MRGLWFESAGIAALLFAVYSFLALDIFYGDGSFIQTGRATGALLHDNHLLNYAVFALGQLVARPFTTDLFGELSVATRLCMVLGVVIAHRTLASLGCTAAQRVLGTLLIGGTGTVFFYATAIERQAPFFPFVALAFHALVRTGRAPTVPRGLLLGMATGVATLVHATGHLLYCIVVPWLVLACERERFGFFAALRALAAAACLHAAITLAAAALAQLALGSNPMASQAGLVAGFARFEIAHLWPGLWGEWLLPFLPGSVLGFLCLAWARTRRLGLAFVAAFVPYQTFSLLILADFDERGAYNLPLVLPLAVGLVRLLPPRLLAVVATLTIATGVTLNREYAATMPSPPSRAQVEEVTAHGKAVVAFLGPWSMRPILRHMPGIATLDVAELARGSLPFADICAAFDRGYAAARAAGYRVVIARQCLDHLEGGFPFSTGQTRFFEEHFKRHYAFVPGKVADFAYAIIEPIPK